MADKRSNDPSDTKADRSMVMVQLPTSLKDRITDLVKDQQKSVNRWIAELIATEFGVTLPTAARRATSLFAIFQKDHPQSPDETEEAYKVRYEAFKKEAQADARAKAKARTEEALSLMETLKAKASEGTLDQDSIAQLLAQLKS